MSTTIDSLQLEIQSRGANAAKGIDDLAKSLGKIKENGGFRTAVNNLERLSRSLDNVPNTHKQSTALRTLAGALEKLKGVGSLSRLNSSLETLPTALSALDKVNVDNSKVTALVDALTPLSTLKHSGFSSMVNAMNKLDKVTKKLDANDGKLIDEFAEKVKRLNDVVAPLSVNMGNIADGFKGINALLRTTNVNIAQANTKVNVGIFNLSNLSNVLSKCWSLLRRIAQGLSDIIDQAKEWDGISVRFGRGFGSQAQVTYDYILKLNDAMDINVQQFMQYSSTYATMLKGFGVAQEDASKMALGYMELTYDVWAGYNDIYKTLDEAATAVRSAISGETEAIRRAGFTIIESTLEQTAANHGLEISLDNATEAQKSYLRYLTLIDQAHSQNLVGTYAKEMNTAEGIMRTLEQQLKSLAQTFGSLFIPLLIKGLPYVQAFVELLTEGIQRLAQLLGVELQTVDFSGYSDGAQSIEGITGALNGATESAKELKNATIGIDELNVISPASNISGGSAPGSNGFENFNVDSLWNKTIFDTIQTDVDNIKTKLEGWMPLITAITILLAGLSLLKFTGELSDAILKTGTLATKLNSLNATKLATSVTSANGALSSTGSILGSLSASSLLTIALAAVAIGSSIAFIAEHWEDLKTTASDFFDDRISPKLENIKGHLNTIKEALSPLAPIIDPIVAKFREWFGDINLLEAYGGYLTAVFGGIGLGLIDNFVGAIENASQAVSGFAQIVSGAFEIAVGVFTLDGEKIISGAESIGGGLEDIFGGFYGFITTPFVTAYDVIFGWFADVGDLILGDTTFSDWLSATERKISKFFTQTIPGKWKDLRTWWDNKPALSEIVPTIDDVKRIVSDAWDSAKLWWDRHKTALKEIAPGIVDIKSKLQTAWNTAKTWWQNSVGGLSTTLSIKVPKISVNWSTVSAFGQEFRYPSGFSLSFAADGGIFDQGSLVWAGERGPEILANAAGGRTGVMNVEQMQQAVYEGVYAAVSAAMSGKRESGTQAVNVYLDGRQITNAVEQRQRERGAFIMGNEVYSY